MTEATAAGKAQDALPAAASWSERRLIVASMACYNVGMLLLWLQPAIIAELLAHRGLSSTNAGAIVTVAMLIEAVVMLAVARVRRAFGYRAVSLLGAALVVVGAAGWLFANGFLALLAALAITGFGFGLLVLVSSMALAGVSRPSATFGQMYSLNLVLASALLFALPAIGGFLGRAPALPSVLLIAALMLPLLLVMPRAAQSRPQVDDAGGAGALQSAIRWFALGVASIGLAYGQVWSFFFVLAKDAGLTEAQASSASGLSLIGALAGSLAVGTLTRFIRDHTLLLISMFGVVGSQLLIIYAASQPVFVVGGMASMFFMYLFFPCLLGAAARCDPTGRGIALLNSCLAILAAAGPSVAGYLLGSAGASGLGTVTVVAGVLALVSFVAAGRAMDRGNCAPA